MQKIHEHRSHFAVVMVDAHELVVDKNPRGYQIGMQEAEQEGCW
jgi:hypothetical protein